MPKRPIREKLLAERRHCSAETCLYLSLRIQERFLDSEGYRQAGCIGLYCAFMNEVQTELVARHALADGKLLAYPRVSGAVLEFVQVSGSGELAPGAFGILEPIGERGVPLAELDLLVVPGVAFDLLGNRLGYGRGFYDRSLANCCPTHLERVGFAYEFQLVDRLPASDHDVLLTQLVTEQRLIRFPAGGQPDH